MRNKILKLLSALFMLTALLPLPRFSAVAAVAESENLVRNSGFEDLAAMPSTWYNDFSSPYEVDENMDGEIDGSLELSNALPGSRSGRAMKFTTYESNLNIWCQQRFFYGTPQKPYETSNQFVAGMTYRMSFKIYIDKLYDYSGESMGLNYTFSTSAYSIDGYACANGWVAYKESTTNGLWTTVSGTVQAPADAKQLRILVRSYAQGVVYIDDVSMEAVEAEKFEYTTSHMFHYADENEVGEVSVSIMPFYHGTGLSETHSVSFGIYDGTTRIAGKDNVKFTNNKAVFTYSPDAALPVKQKKYTLSVSVKDSSGTEAGAFTQSLYRYPRPKFLDADGNFRNRDGEVVDPFIGWGLRPEYYDEGARAGFTMAILPFSEAKLEYQPSRDSYMAAAKEAGLYLIFGLCMNMKAAAHPDNIENTKALVARYKDNPDFVGWIVQDEPLGGGVTEEAKTLLELSYTTIRNIDPNHPVILLDYNMGVFKETSKYCDIFMPNSYGRSHKEVRRYVEEAVKYSNGHPVWPNVAAFANGGGTIDELPSGQQVQHFIYQAFLAGATGVSVYDVHRPVQNPKPMGLPETPIWEPLADTGLTEVPVLFDLFVHGKPPEGTETTDYVERKWTREDGDYYVLLSASDTGATVEYDIGEGKSVMVLGGDDMSDYTLKNGKLSVALRKNTIEYGKEKCFDVQMFKVYETSDGPRVTKSRIKHLVPCLSLLGVERFAAGIYKEADGKEELIRVKWYEGAKKHVALLRDAEEQAAYKMKVFAWDAALRPLCNAAELPPQTNE